MLVWSWTCIIDLKCEFIIHFDEFFIGYYTSYDWISFLIFILVYVWIQLVNMLCKDFDNELKWSWNRNYHKGKFEEFILPY